MDDQRSEMDGLVTLEVDGECFSVRPGDQQGSYHYTGINSPHANYGFGSGPGPGRVLTEEEHLRSIRDYLRMIDPQTGYYKDD